MSGGGGAPETTVLQHVVHAVLLVAFGGLLYRARREGVPDVR